MLPDPETPVKQVGLAAMPSTHDSCSQEAQSDEPCSPEPCSPQVEAAAEWDETGLAAFGRLSISQESEQQQQQQLGSSGARQHSEQQQSAGSGSLPHTQTRRSKHSPVRHSPGIRRSTSRTARDCQQQHSIDRHHHQHLDSPSPAASQQAAASPAGKLQDAATGEDSPNDRDNSWSPPISKARKHHAVQHQHQQDLQHHHHPEDLHVSPRPHRKRRPPNPDLQYNGTMQAAKPINRWW